MTANQYRAAIDRLNLSQAQAAVFLGVSLKQSQRWANAHAPVPEAVAKLLRLMLKLGLQADKVE